VRSVIFSEHEGSYLVGMLAAMASETGTVGFVGGMDIPLISRFACGYAQGVVAVNPEATVIANMTGTTPAAWNDPVRGGELTRGQIAQGATSSMPPPAAPASAFCRSPRTKASSRSAWTATRTTCTPARS
jgi:basic membrane lipoprotein Med (substrate-binding protein (PBP1-ABC) superfamily)